MSKQSIEARDGRATRRGAENDARWAAAMNQLREDEAMTDGASQDTSHHSMDITPRPPANHLYGTPTGDTPHLDLPQHQSLAAQAASAGTLAYHNAFPALPQSVSAGYVGNQVARLEGRPPLPPLPTPPSHDHEQMQGEIERLRQQLR